MLSPITRHESLNSTLVGLWVLLCLTISAGMLDAILAHTIAQPQAATITYSIPKTPGSRSSSARYQISNQQTGEVSWIADSWPTSQPRTLGSTIEFTRGPIFHKAYFAATGLDSAESILLSSILLLAALAGLWYLVRAINRKFTKGIPFYDSLTTKVDRKWIHFKISRAEAKRTKKAK